MQMQPINPLELLPGAAGNPSPGTGKGAEEPFGSILQRSESSLGPKPEASKTQTDQGISTQPNENGRGESRQENSTDSNCCQNENTNETSASLADNKTTVHENNEEATGSDKDPVLDENVGQPPTEGDARSPLLITKNEFFNYQPENLSGSTDDFQPLISNIPGTSEELTVQVGEAAKTTAAIAMSFKDYQMALQDSSGKVAAGIRVEQVSILRQSSGKTIPADGQLQSTVLTGHNHDAPFHVQGQRDGFSSGASSSVQFSPNIPGTDGPGLKPLEFEAAGPLKQAGLPFGVVVEDVSVHQMYKTNNFTVQTDLDQTRSLPQQVGFHMDTADKGTLSPVDLDQRFARLLGRSDGGELTALREVFSSRQRNLGQNALINPSGTDLQANSGLQPVARMTEQFMTGGDSKGPEAQLSWQQPEVMSLSTDQIEAVSDSGKGFTLQGAQQAPSVRLPSGMAVPESHIVEQVIERISIASARESSSINIKMHPEELGRLNMKIIVNKDGVRAHIQAETQQVQEILEKNLPKLREGLEQQGLKLDDIQVSVNSEQSSGQRFQQGWATPDGPHHMSRTGQEDSVKDAVPEEVIAATSGSDGMINLRI